MTSRAKTVDLMLNLIGKRYRGMKRALQCFSLILPSYHTFGDNSDCSRKNRYFLQNWPLVTSILTWPENGLSKSLTSRRGLSNVVCRWSLGSVVFEIRGGFLKPPPPLPRHKLKLLASAKIRVNRRPDGAPSHLRPGVQNDHTFQPKN